MLKKILLVALLFLLNFATAQNDYIHKQIGNIPILLSAPHGGEYKPIQLKDRTGFNFKLNADAYTKDILIETSKELEKIWGISNYVYSNLHRSKLDFNREILEATDTNKLLNNLYHAYHKFIKQTSYNYKNKLLVIDIHGHTHPENMIELGYGNMDIDSTKTNNKSFGFLFNKNYGKSICYPPANQVPTLYFQGGYITQTVYNNEYHIQIEIPETLRNKKNLKKVSTILAKTIYEFYKINFK